MKMCQPHWDALRAAIEERGLMGFVANSGQAAINKVVDDLEGAPEKQTFEPLMAANMAIWNNTMSACAQYNANPLAMMSADPDHPERECPICFLNWLHVEHIQNCTNENCTYPKEFTFNWMIERASDDQLERAREFGFVPPERAN
jgi:hypothetical protein